MSHLTLIRGNAVSAAEQAGYAVLITSLPELPEVLSVHATPDEARAARAQADREGLGRPRAVVLSETDRFVLVRGGGIFSADEVVSEHRSYAAACAARRWQPAERRCELQIALSR